MLNPAENGEAQIADYDPAWPAIFRTYAAALARELGGQALRIEHIGSTAVPGLAAVPVVDLLLVVEDPADEAAYLGRLQASGFAPRAARPDFHEHRVFWAPGGQARLHVVSRGSPEIRSYLTLRDRLRKDPAERRRYEETKRKLAARVAAVRSLGPLGPGRPGPHAVWAWV